MLKYYSVLSLFLALSSATLVACGQNPTLVKQVQIESSGSGQSAEVAMITELELNGFQMGNFQLPIFDPRTGINYGMLSTQPLLNNLAEVKLSIRVGELAGHQNILESAVLPNGNPLPVSTGSESIWMLNAGSNSKIYLGALSNQTVLGFAIVIPEFDQISRNIPIALNLFPVVPLQPDLNLAAGIFTSQRASSSGIAVLADYKKGLVIDIPKPSPAKMAIKSSRVRQSGVQLAAQAPSATHQKELGKRINKLRQKNPLISVK